MKEFSVVENISVGENQSLFLLHKAVIEGNDPFIEKALKSMESIAEVNNFGYTPIYYSAEKKDKSLFKFLLYFQDARIATRLDFENAIKRQDNDTMAILASYMKEYGLNFDGVNDVNQTLLDIAVIYQNEFALKLLQRYGGEYTFSDLAPSRATEGLKQQAQFSYAFKIEKDNSLPIVIFSQNCEGEHSNPKTIRINPWLEAKNLSVYENLSIFLKDDDCYLLIRDTEKEYAIACQLSKSGDLKLCHVSLPQSKLTLATYGECEIDATGYVPQLSIEAKKISSSNKTKLFNGLSLTLIADDAFLEGGLVYKEFKFIIKNSYEQLGELHGETLNLLSHTIVQHGQVILTKQFSVKAEGLIQNYGQWAAGEQGIIKAHALENNRKALIVVQKGEIRVHANVRFINSGALIGTSVFVESGLLLKNNIGGMIKGLSCITQAPEYIQAGFLISGQKNSLSSIDWGLNFAQAGLNISNIVGLVSTPQTMTLRGYLVLAKTLYQGGELLYRYSQGDTPTSSDIVRMILNNVLPTLGFISSQEEKARLLVNVLYHCYGTYLSEEEFVSKSLNVIQLITRTINIATAGMLTSEQVEYLQLAQQTLQYLRFVPKAVEAIQSTYDLLTSHEQNLLDKAQITFSTMIDSMMQEALYQLPPQQFFDYDLPIVDSVKFILNQGHNSDLFLQSVVLGTLSAAKKSGLFEHEIYDDLDFISKLFLRSEQWTTLCKKYQANQLDTKSAMYEVLNSLILITGYGAQKYRQMDAINLADNVSTEIDPKNLTEETDDSIKDSEVKQTEPEDAVELDVVSSTELFDQNIEPELKDKSSTEEINIEDKVETPEEIERRKQEAIEETTQERPEFEHIDYRVDIEEIIEESLTAEETETSVDVSNALTKSLLEVQKAFIGEYAGQGYLGAYVTALHNEGVIDVSGNIEIDVQMHATNNSTVRATGTIGVTGNDVAVRDQHSTIINSKVATSISTQFQNLEAGYISAEETIYWISVGLIENFGVVSAFQDIKIAANRIIMNHALGQVYSANDIDLLCDFLVENEGFIRGVHVSLDGTQEGVSNSGIIVAIEKIRLASRKIVIHEKEGLLISKRLEMKGMRVEKEGAIQAGLVRTKGVGTQTPEVLIWAKNDNDAIHGLTIEAKQSNSFDVDSFNNVHFLDVTIKDSPTATSPTLFNISSEFAHVLQLHISEGDRTIPLYQLPNLSSNATLILDAPGSILSSGGLNTSYSCALYFTGREFSYSSSMVTFEKPAFFDVYTIDGESRASYLGLSEGGGFQAQIFTNYGFVHSGGIIYWNVKTLENNVQIVNYKTSFLYSKLNPTIEIANSTRIIEDTGKIVSLGNYGYIGAFNQLGGIFHSGLGGNLIFFDNALQDAIATSTGTKTSPVLEDKGRNWYMMPGWHNSTISSDGHNFLIGSGKFEARGVDAWGDEGFFLYAPEGLITSTQKRGYHIEATYSVHKGFLKKREEVRHPETFSSVLSKNSISSNHGEVMLVSTKKEIDLENTTVSSAKSLSFIAQGSVKLDGVAVPFHEYYANKKKRIGKSKTIESTTTGIKIHSSYLFTPEGIIVYSDEFSLGAVEGVIENADITAHRVILQGMQQKIQNETITKELSITLPGDKLVDILHGHNAKAIFKTIISVCGWDQTELEQLLRAKHVGEIPLHLLNVAKNAWNVSALVAHACQEYGVSPSNFVGVITDQLGLTVPDGQGGHTLNPNIGIKYSHAKETTEITQMIPSRLYVGGTFRFVGGSLQILDGSEIDAEHLRLFLSEGIKMTKGVTTIDYKMTSFSGSARLNLANLADFGAQVEGGSHHEHTTLQTQALLKARGSVEIDSSYIEGEGVIEGNEGYIKSTHISFTTSQNTKNVRHISGGAGASTSLAFNAHLENQQHEEAITNQKAGISLANGKVQADSIELLNGSKVICQELTRKDGEGVPTVTGTIGVDYIKERNFSAGLGYNPQGQSDGQLTASFKDEVTHQNPTVFVENKTNLGNGINMDPSQETVEVRHRENGIALGFVRPDKDKFDREASEIKKTLGQAKAAVSEITDKTREFIHVKVSELAASFKKREDDLTDQIVVSTQPPLLFRKPSPKPPIARFAAIDSEMPEISSILTSSVSQASDVTGELEREGDEKSKPNEIIEITFDQNGKMSWMRKLDPSTGHVSWMREYPLEYEANFGLDAPFLEKLLSENGLAMKFVTAICVARQNTLNGLKQIVLHPIDTTVEVVGVTLLFGYDVVVSTFYNEKYLKPFLHKKMRDFFHSSKERNIQRLEIAGEILDDFIQGDGPKRTEILAGLVGDFVLGRSLLIFQNKILLLSRKHFLPAKLIDQIPGFDLVVQNETINNIFKFSQSPYTSDVLAASLVAIENRKKSLAGQSKG